MSADKDFSILKYVPAFAERHSEYSLGNQELVPIETVRKLIEDVLLTTPSGFNSMPVRVVLLTGKKHLEHWDIIEGILIRKIGEERYKKSNAYDRIENMARKAVGTILFFDDTDITKHYMEQSRQYRDMFSDWAQQAQGSHQFMIWMGLRALGYGANLQHYIGMEDNLVKEHVGAPESWRFIAHMMFGSINEKAGDKEKLPIDELLKTFIDE